MNLLISLLFLAIATQSSGLGFLNRIFPITFEETEPFSPFLTKGPKSMEAAHFFLENVLIFGNYTMSPESHFVVLGPEKPIVIHRHSYYWDSSYHPPLSNFSSGCRIPMAWLKEAAETMTTFRYRIPPFKEQPQLAMKNFLELLRLDHDRFPNEMVWSCSQLTHCCGVGCCMNLARDNPNSTSYQIFVFVCVGLLILCVLGLIGSIFSFVFNDFWHRYFFWFPATRPPTPRPSSPRPSTPHPSVEIELELLAPPPRNRSPSRWHLTA